MRPYLFLRSFFLALKKTHSLNSHTNLFDRQPYDPFKNTGVGWTFNRVETAPFQEAMSNAMLTYRSYRPSFQYVERVSRAACPCTKFGSIVCLFVTHFYSYIFCACEISSHMCNREIQKRGMNRDLSWDLAAQQYEDVLIAAKYQW